MPDSVPLTGLSLMPEPEFCRASLPLFEDGSVDVVEWSFDTVVRRVDLPDWLEELLTFFGEQNRLLGHGVRYSVLSSDAKEYHENWLELAKSSLSWHSYRHVTEHFGFMTAGDFHRSAPMPVPLFEQSLAQGIENLGRLSECAGLPIGLENLALALSPDDVFQQAEFLTRLLEPVSGFILLDLHNLYCQACNFSVDPEELMKLYPVELVRELHLSGGSWSEGSYSTGGKIRRDTHDDAVPEEVFSMLEFALQHFLKVEFVIFERLGSTLETQEKETQFQTDFRRIQGVVAEFAGRKE